MRLILWRAAVYGAKAVRPLRSALSKMPPKGIPDPCRFLPGSFEPSVSLFIVTIGGSRTVWQKRVLRPLDSLRKGAPSLLFRANKIQRGTPYGFSVSMDQFGVIARGLLWPNCGCEVGLQLRCELWRSCVAEQHGSSVAKSAEGLGETPHCADRRDGFHRPISA